MKKGEVSLENRNFILNFNRKFIRNFIRISLENRNFIQEKSHQKIVISINKLAFFKKISYTLDRIWHLSLDQLLLILFSFVIFLLVLTATPSPCFVFFSFISHRSGCRTIFSVRGKFLGNFFFFLISPFGIFQF